MNIIRRFVAPLIIGLTIGIISHLLDTNIVFDSGLKFSFIVRLLYTFSANYTILLSFIAPLLIMVIVAVGTNNLQGENKLFFIKFFKTIIVTLFILAISTAIISKLFVGYLVSDMIDTKQEWLEPFNHLVINVEPLFNIFVGLLIGMTIGMLAKKNSTIMNVFLESEQIINQLMVKFMLPLMPFWIIGTFAQSGYSNQGIEVVKTDLFLSWLILLIQFLWLFIMYIVASKYSKIAIKKIIKSAFKLYIEVVSLAGNGTGVIVPIAVEAQEELGVNNDKAKIISASSFNMPGSLISNIVFSYGIICMYHLDVTFLMYSMYIVCLVFLLILAPAVPGGVFAASSTILTPLLGFDTGQINLMGGFYYKQGTSNSAVNNAADLYMGPILNKNE